jgi:hypothetical protein
MITAALLREWGACWDDARIQRAFGARAEVTPRDVSISTDVSLDDRLWVLCRAIWYLDESAARMFAIESASLVSHLAGDEDDQAQYLGLMNRLCEIEDLPVEQRAAARAAAGAAAWDSARDAAWAAAGDAAGAAAGDAARAAAGDAAWAAAWAAALQKAIDRAIHWLGDYADGWGES